MDWSEPSFKSGNYIALLSCLKFCISVAYQAPTTLTLPMFFSILKSFPPQGLCTCGSSFRLQFCSRRPRGEGNTSMWPGPHFLLVSWTLRSSQTEGPALLLNLCFYVEHPSFPGLLIHHGPTPMSLCFSQVFTLRLEILSSDLLGHTSYIWHMWLRCLVYFQEYVVMKRAWVLEAGSPGLEYQQPLTNSAMVGTLYVL